MGSESVGVVGGNTGGVKQGGVGLCLPLAVGGVGDHSDIVRPSILDRLGNMCSCGNLTNSPGLGLGLSLPLAVDGIGVARVGVGVGHCSSNSGVGEASNLDSAM